MSTFIRAEWFLNEQGTQTCALLQLLDSVTDVVHSGSGFGGLDFDDVVDRRICDQQPQRGLQILPSDIMIPSAGT